MPRYNRTWEGKNTPPHLAHTPQRSCAPLPPPSPPSPPKTPTAPTHPPCGPTQGQGTPKLVPFSICAFSASLPPPLHTHTAPRFTAHPTIAGLQPATHPPTQLPHAQSPTHPPPSGLMVQQSWYPVHASPPLSTWLPTHGPKLWHIPHTHLEG